MITRDQRDELEAIRKLKQLEYAKMRKAKNLALIRGDVVEEEDEDNYLFDNVKNLIEEDKKKMQTQVISDDDRKEYKRIMRRRQQEGRVCRCRLKSGE